MFLGKNDIDKTGRSVSDNLMEKKQDYAVWPISNSG